LNLPKKRKEVFFVSNFSNKFYNKICRIVRNERGQGMVEYGLLTALIAVALIVAVVSMRDEITATFTAIQQGLLNR
jgi:pilus assembly protein Flp/PilA